LAAGSGDIFQISQAFRHEQQGRLHNPEFTLLEWYRVGFNHHQLMDEMDTFLQSILHCPRAQRYSYQALFEKNCQLNPHTATIEKLKTVAKQHDLLDTLGQECTNRDDWLMLLFSIVIEPTLGLAAPCFIDEYPASQAALAKVNNGVAERFEVYLGGVELANGFHELQDPITQRERFRRDLATRRQLGKPTPPIDERFLAALEFGLPACAGVALGIDRLVMLALDKASLADVISFTTEHA
jgi:elongation factor P--(R)-beta-lysine ligase